MKFAAIALYIASILLASYMVFKPKQNITTEIVITPTLQVPTDIPTATPYIFSENGLYQLVQDWKLQEHGYTYKPSESLCTIANSRLNEIDGDWSHEGFYKYAREDSVISENLSQNFFAMEDAFQAWLDSPTHRENLEKDYTHSCLTCDGNRCVQVFGYY